MLPCVACDLGLKEFCITTRFGLGEGRPWDVRSWRADVAGKAARAWAWAWGSLICAECVLVTDLGFRGGWREDLTFRRCWGSAGRRSRVGGREWAWWSAKELEARFWRRHSNGVSPFVFRLFFPACGCLASYRRVYSGAWAG